MRNRDLNIFWLVQTLSTAGDTFSMVAIPLLVLHVTGSVVQMGLVTATAGVANIIAGVFAGVVVDRFDRRKLLIYSDIARGVLYGAIPMAWLFGTPIWLVYIVVPLCAALAMFFQVSYVAVLPSLVDADQITRANGRMYASYAAAGVAGPVLAGILAARFGPTAAIGVDALTFFLSATGIFLVRFRAMDVSAPEPFWRNLSVGARFLARHPVLRSLTALLTLLLFVHLGLIDIIIYYLKHDLHQGDTTVGYTMAIAAIGTIAGSLVVARLRHRLGFGVTWIGSTMLCGAAIAGLGLSGAVQWITLLAMAAFFFTSIAGICSMSLRQQVTPSELLGRVTSAYWTIHNTLGPIGAAVLTAAVAGYGVKPVLLAAGVAYLFVAACGVLTPIRLARPEQLAVQPA